MEERERRRVEKKCREESGIPVRAPENANMQSETAHTNPRLLPPLFVQCGLLSWVD